VSGNGVLGLLWGRVASQPHEKIVATISTPCTVQHPHHILRITGAVVERRGAALNPRAVSQPLGASSRQYRSQVKSGFNSRHGTVLRLLLRSQPLMPPYMLLKQRPQSTTVVYVLVGCGDPSPCASLVNCRPHECHPPHKIWSGFSVWSARNVTLARRLLFHFDPRATRMRWIPTTNQKVNDSIHMQGTTAKGSLHTVALVGRGQECERAMLSIPPPAPSRHPNR
jgi:hypothetical protein